MAMGVLQRALDTIDDYNWLTGVVAVLVSSALANVALSLGDRMLAGTLLPLVGATLGFCTGITGGDLFRRGTVVDICGAR